METENSFFKKYSRKYPILKDWNQKEESLHAFIEENVEELLQTYEEFEGDYPNEYNEVAFSVSVKCAIYATEKETKPVMFVFAAFHEDAPYFTDKGLILYDSPEQDFSSLEEASKILDVELKKAFDSIA